MDRYSLITCCTVGPKHDHRIGQEGLVPAHGHRSTMVYLSVSCVLQTLVSRCYLEWVPIKFYPPHYWPNQKLRCPLIHVFEMATGV